MPKFDRYDVELAHDACFSDAVGGRGFFWSSRPLTIGFRSSYGTSCRNMTMLGASEDNHISGDLPQQGYRIFTYFFLKIWKER